MLIVQAHACICCRFFVHAHVGFLVFPRYFEKFYKEIGGGKCNLKSTDTRSSERCQLRAYHAGLLRNYYVILLIRIINEALIFLVLFWMSILTILVYVLFLMLLDFEMGVIALHTKELQSFLHLHVHFEYIKKHF